MTAKRNDGAFNFFKWLVAAILALLFLLCMRGCFEPKAGGIITGDRATATPTKVTEVTATTASKSTATMAATTDTATTVATATKEVATATPTKTTGGATIVLPTFGTPDIAAGAPPLLTLSGKAQPNSRLRLEYRGDEIDTVDVGRDGTWKLPTSYFTEPGRYVIAAIPLDANDKPIANSSANVTVNIKADDILLSAPDFSWTGVKSGDTVSPSAKITLVGTGVPSSTINLDIDGKLVESVSADAEGNWTWDSSIIEQKLEAGRHAIAATTVGPNGELGLATADFRFRVRESATAEPTSPAETGLVTPTLKISAESTPPIIQLEGTGAPNSLLAILIDGKFVDKVIVDEDGRWNWTTQPLQAGDHRAQVQLIGIGGGKRILSEIVTWSIESEDGADAIIPPTIGINYDPTGNTVTYSGKGEPNSSLQLLLNDKLIDTVKVDKDGNWSWEGDVPTPGEYRVSAQLVDDDGKTVLANTKSLLYRVPDSASENAPTFVVQANQETGVIELSGSAEPTKTIQIVVNNEIKETLKSDENGVWSWSNNFIEPGSYNVSAQLIDDAGALIATSEVATLNVKAVPTFKMPQSVDDFAGGRFTVAGTAPPVATIEILIDGKVVGTVKPDQDGNWKWDGELTQVGVYTITARTKDKEGKVVAESEEAKFNITPTMLKASLIPSVAKADGSFNTLVQALGKAKLVTPLNGDGPFTLFAPTDAAFDRLPDGSVEALLADEKLLQRLLLHHVVPSQLSAQEVGENETLTTSADTTLNILSGGGVTFVDQAQVVRPDIQADNGVIHAIDTVLLPSTNIVAPVVDDSGVPTFKGPLLTVVGTAEPDTMLLLELNGQFFGQTKVGEDGNWLLADTISKGFYEIIAYTMQDKLPLAMSNVVYLEVGE